MKTKNIVSGLAMLGVGVGIGTAVGFLFAPQSGRQTRKLISRAAEDSADFVAKRGRDVRRQAEGAFERSKKFAVKGKRFAVKLVA